MTRRRHLLIVILIYVALDLSLSEMPGAFVFDPAESVESIDAARGRSTVKLVALAAPARAERIPVQHAMRSEVPPSLPSGADVALSRRSVVRRLPRAITYASPRAAEDSH
jgi:hypothetical protein